MKRGFLDRKTIDNINKEHSTPYHIYDEAGIIKNAHELYKAFSWNKGFKEYFAVKATPNPYILDVLKSCGCGCDCSSYTELMMSNAVGIVGEDIMFSSNETPPEDYILADKLGAIINLDDITHIEYLKRLLGQLPEVMSVRYNPGGVFKISNTIMDNPGDAKYGFTKEQVIEGVKILSKEGVKRIGLHAFLASNTVTNEYYPMLAAQLFELAVEIKLSTGVSISFINLSGGIGIPYMPNEEANDIIAIGEGVRIAYERILTSNGLGDVDIYTELGRYMLGPYGHLVTKVIHTKDTYKKYIGCDSCAVDLMRPAMYGAYHHITIAGKEEEDCDHMYDVVGSLCENNDKFAIDRMMPKVEIGDILIIHDTGAHGQAMGYNYNGKLKSKELMLRANGSVELIRREESSKDYFATFDNTKYYEKLINGDKI